MTVVQVWMIERGMINYNIFMKIMFKILYACDLSMITTFILFIKKLSLQ